MEANSETYDCTYVYAADQQHEVRRIFEKYLPHNEDKMEQLRKLDRSVTRPGKAAALLLGLGGSLLHGIGINYTLTAAGTVSAAATAATLLGVLAICSAYPIYRYITARLRRRLAPQIIELCRELLK